MKNLKYLERLFVSKITMFRSITDHGMEEFYKGLIEGFELALIDVRKEIKELDGKRS